MNIIVNINNREYYIRDIVYILDIYTNDMKEEFLFTRNSEDAFDILTNLEADMLLDKLLDKGIKAMIINRKGD